MTIDIERLKTDAAYWDKVAPEGAEFFIRGNFFKSSKNKDFAFPSSVYGLGFGWGWSNMDRESVDHREDVIPRPTKPAEVECDVVEAELHEGEDCWYEAVVIGQTIDGSRKVVQWVDSSMSKNSVSTLLPSQVRPIKTPEQRQTDRLAVLIATANAMCDLKQKEDPAGFIAECIMNEYNLEPKK